MKTFLVVTEKTLLMRIYSSRLNILCCFFNGFIFGGTNIKGKIFSGWVRLHPSHPLSYTPDFSMLKNKPTSFISSYQVLIESEDVYFFDTLLTLSSK